MAAAAAAADSVQRIKAEATCSICLELLRNPLTTKCGHSFCKQCIDQLRKGREDATCPQCRQPLPKGTVRRNKELRNIVASFRPQAKEKPSAENTCKRHQEPLKLYCNEDQIPICVVCMLSQAHRGHTVVPKEEAVKEYRGKMAEQLGVIESSCGKLHQFVNQIWKHLPQNEREEEHLKLARVCEKLTELKVRTESPEERSEHPASQIESEESSSGGDSSESDDYEEPERRGHSGREPGSEPAAETQGETGSQVGPVGEEAPKDRLNQASLDPTVLTISNTREAEKFKHLEGIESGCQKLLQLESTDRTHLPLSALEEEHQRLKRLTDNVATLSKVDAKEPRKRPKDGSSPTPTEGSGGEQNRSHIC